MSLIKEDDFDDFTEQERNFLYLLFGTGTFVDSVSYRIGEIEAEIKAECEARIEKINAEYKASIEEHEAENKALRERNKILNFLVDKFRSYGETPRDFPGPVPVVEIKRRRYNFPEGGIRDALFNHKAGKGYFRRAVRNKFRKMRRVFS